MTKQQEFVLSLLYPGEAALKKELKHRYIIKRGNTNGLSLAVTWLTKNYFFESPSWNLIRRRYTQETIEIYKLAKGNDNSK